MPAERRKNVRLCCFRKAEQETLSELVVARDVEAGKLKCVAIKGKRGSVPAGKFS